MPKMRKKREKYQTGQRVLVMVDITELEDSSTVHPDGTYQGTTAGSKRFSVFNDEDIYDLAPEPDVDWADVPVGTNVEVRTGKDMLWKPAWFIRHDEREDIFHALSKPDRINIMHTECRLPRDGR